MGCQQVVCQVVAKGWQCALSALLNNFWNYYLIPSLLIMGHNGATKAMDMQILVKIQFKA